MSSHYRTVHPEFFIEYQLLNRAFLRFSLAIILVSLVSIPVLVFGPLQLAVLVWGLLLVSWFAFTLLIFQTRFDETSDRSLDEWRYQRKPSSIGEIVTGPTGRGGTPLRCPICKGGPFGLGLGLRYHGRVTHPEYFSWYSQWVRTIESVMMMTGSILLVLEVTGILPLGTQYNLLILVGPVLLFVAIFAGNRSRKQSKWRRDWTQHHMAY